MTNNGYWFRLSSVTLVRGGDVITQGASHTMMAVYGDGASRRISAHTSDHRNYLYTGATDTYWDVHYYIPY